MSRLVPGVLVATALLATAGFSWMQLSSTAAEEPETEAREKTPEEKHALAKFMRQKLDASRKVLEGLCVEDYELIIQGARALQKISSAEKWRASNDAIYRQHSVEFQRAVKKLEKNARNKKLDSAALTWLEATMGCIECHRFVRAMLVADNPRLEESLKTLTAAGGRQPD